MPEQNIVVFFYVDVEAPLSPEVLKNFASPLRKRFFVYRA